MCSEAMNFSKFSICSIDASPVRLTSSSGEQLTSFATPGLLLSTSAGPHGAIGPEASMALDSFETDVIVANAIALSAVGAGFPSSSIPLLAAAAAGSVG